MDNEIILFDENELKMLSIFQMTYFMFKLLRLTPIKE